MFHYGYFALDVHVFNLQLFALLILTLYKSLDWYEDFAFTNPINVSTSYNFLALLFRLVKNFANNFSNFVMFQ